MHLQESKSSPGLQCHWLLFGSIKEYSTKRVVLRSFTNRFTRSTSPCISCKKRMSCEWASFLKYHVFLLATRLSFARSPLAFQVAADILRMQPGNSRRLALSRVREPSKTPFGDESREMFVNLFGVQAILKRSRLAHNGIGGVVELPPAFAS